MFKNRLEMHILLYTIFYEIYTKSNSNHVFLNKVNKPKVKSKYSNRIITTISFVLSYVFQESEDFMQSEVIFVT